MILNGRVIFWSQKRTASLAVIKGRRRIGKSRLAEEFGKPLRTYNFTGLPPDKKMTVQHQRTEFARQIQEQLNIPGLRADDWGDLFWHLAQHVKEAVEQNGFFSKIIDFGNFLTTTPN